MTAVPDWDITDSRSSDADLVRASLAGDRAAFGQVYDRYANRLHDFCIGMLRDREAAADCVQDAFCIAAARLPQLREPDKLRPWLYSISRNEALRILRERRRETPSDEVPDEPSDEPGPETLAARTELAALIAEAAGGLSDRDQAVLELTYRHGLEGPELAEALDVSHTNANTMVFRLRETIEKSLGALLVARRVQSDPTACSALSELLEGWDGHFTVLMRKRVARHIAACPSCDEERHELVSPAALLGAGPLFVPAPAGLRDLTLDKIRLPRPGTPAATPPAAGPDRPAAAGGGRGLFVVALVLGAVLVAVGVGLVWSHQADPPVTPTDLTSTKSVTPSSPSSAPPTGGGKIPPSALPPETTATTPTTTIPTTVPPPARTTRTSLPAPPADLPTVDQTPVLDPTTPAARPSPPTTRVGPSFAPPKFEPPEVITGELPSRPDRRVGTPPRR